jgi:hypothetical protein
MDTKYWLGDLGRGHVADSNTNGGIILKLIRSNGVRFELESRGLGYIPPVDEFLQIQ